VLSLFAYVDPGAGLMLVQILSASIAGIALSFKKVRSWLWNLFRGGRGR